MHKELQDKKAELESCVFIVENCLYLLWSHLDYYMLQAIPNKTLGINTSTGKSETNTDILFIVQSQLSTK